MLGISDSNYDDGHKVTLELVYRAHTIFIQIVTATTSVAGMSLLIEGGYYLTAAFVIVRPHGTCVPSWLPYNWQTSCSATLKTIMIEKQAAVYVGIDPSQGCLLSCFCLDRTTVHRL